MLQGSVGIGTAAPTQKLQVAGNIQLDQVAAPTAPTGWIMWAKSLKAKSGNGALQSVTAANYKIGGSTAPGASSHALTNGSEDYGIGATINTDAAGGGVVSLDPAYDGTFVKVGTLDPTQFRPIASATIINLNQRATIAGQTPATNYYTDTLTVMAAGVF